MNIYERLSTITDELNAVAKNLTVGVGNSKYKGVGEADVLSAVKPLEKKYGVYSYPMDREIVYAETFKGQKAGYKPTDPPKTTYKFVIRIKTIYRFVNIEKPSEYVDQVVFSDGEDPMDKAPGKAMTYGDKYALLKAYKIITGDDPDQYSSNDTTPTNYTQQPTNHSSMKGKTEAQVKQEGIKKGLQTIMRQLDKVENIPYKDSVIKQICMNHDVKEFNQLTFNSNDEYLALLNEVKKQIETEKDLAQMGI